jgi:ribonucleotide monophosphatase NagD (HAD superfamily)
VDAVYVGWHPDCGMKDIEAACNAIFAGAKLYVASDVPFFATRHGRSIGYSFAIVGAIRRVTHAPMILTGKPSRHAMRFVAQRLGIPVSRVGVVGDDPVVEMSMARRFGAAAFRRDHRRDLGGRMAASAHHPASAPGAQRSAPASPPYIRVGDLT